MGVQLAFGAVAVAAIAASYFSERSEGAFGFGFLAFFAILGMGA